MAAALKDLPAQILKILTKAKRALGAYDILTAVNQTADKPYAPPQIYRALKSLAAQKHIHRLESKNAYIACRHMAHAHGDNCTHDVAVQFLVCENCDATAEIEMPLVVKNMQLAAKTAGFTITQPIIELVGRCAACQAA